MIILTRLNGTRICINAFLIEHLEETPDTVITLTNGEHFIVRETVEEVMQRAVEYLGSLRKLGADPITLTQLGRISPRKP